MSLCAKRKMRNELKIFAKTKLEENLYYEIYLVTLNHIMCYTIKKIMCVCVCVCDSKETHTLEAKS